MQWFTEHLRVAIALGMAALVGSLWRVGVLQGMWRAGKGAVQLFRESELRTALKECRELKTAKAQLEADLRQGVRTNLAYADINTQDRATIRTLVAKIDQHNAAHLTLRDDRLCLIDYSDLYDEITRSLTGREKTNSLH